VKKTGNFRNLAVGALALLLLAAVAFASPRQYEVTGLLLAFDPAQRTITVSCKEIPGYMDAMVMSFSVQDKKLPDGLVPGATVAFTLTVEKNSTLAGNLRVQPFESLELDPTQARRLKLLENATRHDSSQVNPLRLGDPVPDFHLTDQNRQAISLSQFKGKIVALTFIYTRCPFPDYCVRLSNNFGVMQRRFKDLLGKDLVLLTIVIDPVHDQPDALKTYAHTWNAEAHHWHFLTGPVADIQDLCRRFDMAFYPDEALFIHSFHTAVIDRNGRLAANLEGNNFTAKQLGDLVELEARKESPATH
jgi:protein SCO1/2